MKILSDGTTRSENEILAEAVKQHLLAAGRNPRHHYTALIEYIARANTTWRSRGAGRRMRLACYSVPGTGMA
jgi:hypothetical protein